MPETTWSPRWVIEAKPWTSASATPNAMPASTPSQALPVICATAAAAKAAPSILPSSAMSTTPERSQNRPAMRGEHQRHRQPDRAVQHQQELEGDLSQHQAGTALGRRRANRASSCGRNMFSSAPANRMTRPWITTTRSLLIRGMSKASSVPPW